MYKRKQIDESSSNDFFLRANEKKLSFSYITSTKNSRGNGFVIARWKDSLLERNWFGTSINARVSVLLVIKPKQNESSTFLFSFVNYPNDSFRSKENVKVIVMANDSCRQNQTLSMDFVELLITNQHFDDHSYSFDQKPIRNLRVLHQESIETFLDNEK